MEMEKLERLFYMSEAFLVAASTAPERTDPSFNARINASEQAEDIMARCLRASIDVQDAILLASVYGDERESVARTNFARMIEAGDDVAALALLGGASEDRVAAWIPEEFRTEECAADLDSLGRTTLPRLCRLGR